MPNGQQDHNIIKWCLQSFHHCGSLTRSFPPSWHTSADPSVNIKNVQHSKKFIRQVQNKEWKSVWRNGQMLKIVFGHLQMALRMDD